MPLVAAITAAMKNRFAEPLRAETAFLPAEFDEQADNGGCDKSEKKHDQDPNGAFHFGRSVSQAGLMTLCNLHRRLLHLGYQNIKVPLSVMTAHTDRSTPNPPGAATVADGRGL